MGCFCRHVTVPPVAEPDPASDPATDPTPEDEPRAPPVIAALSSALSARWLPAAIPWEPDPEWLQLELPPVPMAPATLSTVISLVHARLTILLLLKLDPLQPAHEAQLARIVATLNLRSEAFAPLAEDRRPWSALAQLNGQVDTVQQALSAKVFEPAHQDEAEPIGPWRPLLAQLKPLAPVLAVIEMLKLDPRDPVAALNSLTVTIRRLRQVTLPPLERPHLIMQVIARNDAVARLEKSLGPSSFEEMRDKVEKKLQAVQEQLPPGLSVGPAGRLEGVPDLAPNPSLIINAPTVAAARQLDPAFVAGLNWKVPILFDAPLLTVGAPVAALVKGGMGPVRLSPCDGDCDAARALATTRQGSEIGAAPAA